MEWFKKFRFSKTSYNQKKLRFGKILKTWKKGSGFIKNKKKDLHVIAIDYGIKKIF